MAGRPVFASGESEVLQQDGVGLYDREERSKKFEKGIVYLTTHRLIWVDSTDENHIYIRLSELHGDVERWIGFAAWSHPKLKMTVKNSSSYFKLSFRSYGMEMFLKKFKSVFDKALFDKNKINFDLVTTTNTSGTINPTTSDITLSLDEAKVTGFCTVIGVQSKRRLNRVGNGSTATFSFQCVNPVHHDLHINYTSSTPSELLCIIDKGLQPAMSISFPPSESGTHILTFFHNTGPCSLTFSHPTAEGPSITGLIVKPHTLRKTVSSSTSHPSLGVSGIVNKIREQEQREDSTLSVCYFYYSCEAKLAKTD